MFKNDAEQNAYVPSKSMAIKPDVVSNVIPTDQSRALLPSYLGFVDPRETYVKFNLSMAPNGGGRSVGMIRPQKEAGAHALFRNVLLRDGTNSTTLESYEDYNAHVAMKQPYTAQDSLTHKRELFEGVMSNANLAGDTGNLYYGGSDALDSADYETAEIRVGNKGGRNAPGKVLTPQLQFRLDTGLMRGNQVIPVAALQGLRTQIDMENTLRACEIATGELGTLEATGGSSGGYVLNAVSVKQDTTLGVVASQNDVRAVGTQYTQSFFSVQVKVEAADATTPTANRNNPFDVGDKLFVRSAIGKTIGGTTITLGNQDDTELELGVITGFYVSSDTAYNLGIYYTPQRAPGASLGNFPGSIDAGSARQYGEDDVVFFKVENRALAQSNVLTDADSGAVVLGSGTGNFVAPEYHLENLEYICLSVQPPEAYVSGLLKAASSERGVSMDIQTTTTQRFNQSTAAGLTANHIPCSQKRVKSVFIQPLVVSDFRDLAKRSLSGVPDRARSYQFVYGNELIPTKNVGLTRYSANVPLLGSANQDIAEQNYTEAIHLAQLEAALVNSGNMPRSLHQVSKNFVIGRAFSKYNQVADLSEQSLSARIDYENDATSLKIFNNYIEHLRRISITSSGVMASDL